MKWKSMINGLKASIFITFKNALQQKAMIICIPGSYKRIWDEGNSIVIEKVLIKQISALADMYKIVKMTWKHNGFDNKEFKKLKVYKWIATYDNSKRILEEVARERKCSFLPEDLLLYINDEKYKKIIK